LYVICWVIWQLDMLAMNPGVKPYAPKG